MDSINKQQSEKNHEDLNGREAISKMKELVDKAKTCFFCTQSQNAFPMETRPMSVQKFDDEGNFWFLSANDSHKNKEIQLNNNVQLLFQGSAHSHFLWVLGKATITTDKKIIKELWEPLVKTWFTEGVDDSRITAIKIEPTEGYYWDNKHGNAAAFVKMIIGSAIGKTMDDSIEGNIKL